MDIKAIVGRVFNGPAFFDQQNTGTKSLGEFQQVVAIALQAERDGLLDGVFTHATQQLGEFDQLYILGATERGRALLGEP